MVLVVLGRQYYGISHPLFNRIWRIIETSSILSRYGRYIHAQNIASSFYRVWIRLILKIRGLVIAWRMQRLPVYVTWHGPSVVRSRTCCCSAAAAFTLCHDTTHLSTCLPVHYIHTLDAEVVIAIVVHNELTCWTINKLVSHFTSNQWTTRHFQIWFFHTVYKYTFMQAGDLSSRV